jgi:hypothetical protein
MPSIKNKPNNKSGSVKSNIITRISNINFYGYKKKKMPPFSAFKKHKIEFNSKIYELSLSEIKDKIIGLKQKHSQVKDKRLEALKYNGKFDLTSLRKESLSLKCEISKLEILENLILQKELINKSIQERTNFELSSAVTKEYKRFVKELTKTTNNLFSGKNSYKKDIYFSHIMKIITKQMLRRNDESRHRLFRHATKEILKKPLEQLDLSLYKN